MNLSLNRYKDFRVKEAVYVRSRLAWCQAMQAWMSRHLSVVRDCSQKVEPSSVQTSDDMLLWTQEPEDIDLDCLGSIWQTRNELLELTAGSQMWSWKKSGGKLVEEMRGTKEGGKKEVTGVSTFWGEIVHDDVQENRRRTMKKFQRKQVRSVPVAKPSVPVWGY